ncbi:MAG: SEL1-like repeat protein [Muribaculaceae bacterium]|nr:SEL1-like repeat protein [Muribaculaceae bacterium]
MAHEQALPIGFKLIGGLHEYTVEQVLGQGGFGITYKVKARIKAGNIKVTTHFAVKEFFPSNCWRSHDSCKMLHAPTVSEDIKESLADFIYEGKRLQRICSINPNIVQVNEVFEANDTAYYVMEYLDGGDLRKLVKNSNGGNGLSEQQMLSIMLPVGNAVQCLHDNNMLHLDIKPDNIVMRHDDEGGPDVPVLIDFGLAVHFDKKGTPTSKTPSLGISAGYSPIEQYSQLRHFDPRLDVYAFSATCLYMLTGKDPIEAIRKPDNFVSSVLPATVSKHISRAIEHGMNKEKVSRTDSINKMIDELTLVDEKTEEDIPPKLPDDASGSIPIGQSSYVSPMYDSNNTKAPVQQFQQEKSNKRKPLLITLICLGILAFIGLGYWGATSLLDNGKKSKISSGSTGSSSSGEDKDITLRKALADTIYCEELVNAAENGDSEAQNILGECYYLGYGVDENKGAAIEWFEKAANQGYIDAQFSLGACYYDGEGVSKNYEEAVKWLTKAANNGHVVAQYILAICYDNGEGVLQNKETAFSLYLKAAEQGLPLAINDLGACYEFGEGVNIDISKAIELYTEAAEYGLSMAQYNLGRCYENGIGVTKDLNTAVEWYRMAADQGFEDAITALKRLGY